MSNNFEAYGGVPPMPWFGLDIGGTLTKLVYFEPTDSQAPATPPPQKHTEQVQKINNYKFSNSF